MVIHACCRSGSCSGQGISLRFLLSPDLTSMLLVSTTFDQYWKQTEALSTRRESRLCHADGMSISTSSYTIHIVTAVAIQNRLPTIEMSPLGEVRSKNFRPTLFRLLRPVPSIRISSCEREKAKGDSFFILEDDMIRVRRRLGETTYREAFCQIVCLAINASHLAL
jgi:hypothetical protein